MNDKFLEILSKSSGRTITRPYDGSLLIKLDLPELEKFAELIVNKHLSIWEQMDNGNAVAGYVEMEDYPKAILKYFGVKE